MPEEHHHHHHNGTRHPGNEYDNENKHWRDGHFNGTEHRHHPEHHRGHFNGTEHRHKEHEGHRNGTEHHHFKPTYTTPIPFESGETPVPDAAAAAAASPAAYASGYSSPAAAYSSPAAAYSSPAAYATGAYATAAAASSSLPTDPASVAQRRNAEMLEDLLSSDA
jgi:hypothetical protein